MRRVFKSLPSEVVAQVLQLIEQAATRGPSITYPRLSEIVSCPENVLIQSHIGGVPYAESGDDWPQGTSDGEPS